MINEKLVEQILDIKLTDNYTRFNCGYAQLKSLLLLEQALPDETQNESPSISEFLGFCEKHNTGEKEVIFEGYVINNTRDDARVSVEGIVLNQDLSSEEVKKDFILTFRDADEFDMSDTYRAWWD